MEQIKSSSEQLLSVLSNVPYLYLPTAVCEAMYALRKALTYNITVADRAKRLVESIDENTDDMPHHIASYVDNLNLALIAA